MVDNTQGQAIVEVRSEVGIAEQHGSREQIREMVDRIKVGLPGLPATTDNNARVLGSAIQALASSAIAHGLDPFNGELWIIYNRNKNEAALMAGIKGLRKSARRQDKAYWLSSFKFLKNDQYEEFGVLDTNTSNKIILVATCKIRRTDSGEIYFKRLQALLDGKVPYAAAIDLLGPIPSFEGIGIVRANDKSKMEKTQLARKRAEADALKRAFDLPFLSEENDFIVEGAVTQDTVATPQLQETFTNGEVIEESPVLPDSTPQGDESAEGGTDTPTEQTETQEALPLPSDETLMSALTGNHIAAICQSAREVVGVDNDFHFVARMKKHYPEAKGNYKSVPGTFGDFISKMKTSSTPGKEKSDELEKHFAKKDDDGTKACVECGVIGDVDEEVVATYNDEGVEAWLCHECLDTLGEEEVSEELPWSLKKKTIFWNRATELGLEADEIYKQAGGVTPAQFFMKHGERAAYALIEGMATDKE